MDTPNYSVSSPSLLLQQSTLKTNDGTELYYQYIKQPKPAELILFVHGYSEHSDCYLSMMEWFYHQGYHVASFDVRGHGKSTGSKGFVQNFQQYSEDLHQVISAVKEHCHPSAMNIIAHSNGGLITSYYMLTYHQPATINRIILSAPYLGLHPKLFPPSIIQWPLKQCVKLYRQLKIPSPTKGQLLTHDPEIVNKIQHDKLRLQVVSIQWFVAAEQAQQTVLEKAHQWPNIPLLLLLAGDDLLANSDCSQCFYQQITTNDKKCINYPDTYHEILNELNREATFQDILCWMQ